MALTGAMFLLSYPIQHSINALPLARALRWGSFIPGFIARSKFRRLEILEYEFARCEVYESENRVERYVDTLKADYIEPKQMTAELIEPETLPQPLELFDWKLFDRKSDKYPHLAFLGDSGGGKTYCAEWLALTQLDGKTIASLPHWKPGDFQGFPIYSVSSNYGTKLDKPVAFEQLLDGSLLNEQGVSTLSTVSIVRSIHAEMRRRYAERVKGKTFEVVNIVLDELVSALDDVPDLSKDLIQIWREARKVGLRTICLIQENGVEGLKLKGRSGVRKSLKFVRFGDFAEDYAKALKDEQILEYLKTHPYSVMVGDVPAQVRTITNRKPPLSSQSSLASGLASESLPIIPTLNNVSLTEGVGSPEEVALPGLTPEVVMAVKQAKQEGKSNTYIVEKVMGFKGRKFKQGRNLLSQIEEYIDD
jgi:hypothetical protein